MADDEELITRSREIRAQAEALTAWAKSVRETSIAITEELVNARKPFGLPAKPTEAELIAIYFPDQVSGRAESTPDTRSGRAESIRTR